jgi:hypothetical protein
MGSKGALGVGRSLGLSSVSETIADTIAGLIIKIAENIKLANMLKDFLFV